MLKKEKEQSAEYSVDATEKVQIKIMPGPQWSNVGELETTLVHERSV